MMLVVNVYLYRQMQFYCRIGEFGCSSLFSLVSVETRLQLRSQNTIANATVDQAGFDLSRVGVLCGNK